MLSDVIYKIRKTVSDNTNSKLINSTSVKSKPCYPYTTFNITIPYRLDPFFGIEDIDIIKNEEGYDDINERLILEPQMIMSISSYSDNHNESLEEAMSLNDFFKYNGYDLLADKNIVVVEVGDVNNRSALEINKYEYRFGFDVRLRYLHEINRRNITIEKAKYKMEVDRYVKEF